MKNDPWIIFGLMQKNSRRFPQLYQEILHSCPGRLSLNETFIKTIDCIARELHRRMEVYKWRRTTWPPDGNAPWYEEQ